MLISNFPQNLLDEHMDWHHHHETVADRTKPGYGDEFLSFHRSFISKVKGMLIHDMGMDPVKVAPWTEIPIELKTLNSQGNPRYGWNTSHWGQEQRILNRSFTFYTSDELGRFVDMPTGSGFPTGLHEWVHNQVGFALGEGTMSSGPDNEGMVLANLNQAPRSNLFYRWHGLIDNWWRRWEMDYSNWPKTIDWYQLGLGGVSGPGLSSLDPLGIGHTTLADRDVISATLTPNALPPASSGQGDAVDFVLSSTLPMRKEINVPDGETASSWNIATGADTWGKQTSSASVALWAHQVHNGQKLTFSKMKPWASWFVMEKKYQLGGLEILPPRSRVTFTWVKE